MPSYTPMPTETARFKLRTCVSTIGIFTNNPASSLIASRACTPHIDQKAFHGMRLRHL
jgi:hypothetical protein